MQALETEILIDPKKAPVIPGTGRLRKLRFALPGRGKSGSIRVCYVDYEAKETVYVFTMYPKSEKENLTQEERNDIKKAIGILENLI